MRNPFRKRKLACNYDFYHQPFYLKSNGELGVMSKDEFVKQFSKLTATKIDATLIEAK